jgi:hypothetical protein
VTLPVEVEVVLASGRRKVLVWDGTGDAFHMETDGEQVVSALVDPAGKLLIDTNRLNNGMTGRAAHAPGRPASVLALLTLLTQVAGSVLMP